jgi:hypothetical protein
LKYAWWARAAQRRNLAVICLALVGVIAMLGMALANSSTWGVDFNQYYAAGKLAGTGHLYDWDAIRPLELERNSKAVPYGRFPVFAFAFKPLSSLPYGLARVLWLCIGIAALACFVAMWPLSRRSWACVAICWSGPVAMCLAFGQDSVLFLFFVALGLRLLTRGRDFWAGVALSVCASKPHLAVLLPVVLVATQKWRALLGGIAGGVALMLVSFAVEGPPWPDRLLSLMRLADFDPAGNRMPNTRGLLSFFGESRSAETALTLVVVAAVWWLSSRLQLRSVFTLALACGLLVSHHAYFYDALLMLPALLLPFEEPHPEWLRKWALVLFTPVPYLLLLTKADLPGHLAVSGYTVALMGAMGYALWRGNPGTRIALGIRDETAVNVE